MNASDGWLINSGRLVWSNRKAAVGDQASSRERWVWARSRFRCL